MVTTFRAVLILLIAAVAALGVSFIGGIATPSVATAQENARLKVIADLMVRKAFKNSTLGQLCDLFHLRHPIGGGDCKSFAAAADDDDLKGRIYPKGWRPSFFAYFEEAPTATRVILATQSATSGYAFLTGVEGELQRAALGRNGPRDWQWSNVAINTELRGIFAREVLYWVNSQKDLEALPDRKD